MITVMALIVLMQAAPVDEARAQRLDAQLRCVVCQNQSIADSDAELANVMRELVRERMAAGDSDDEVLAYVTDRYGEYVLLNPSRSAKNMVLWMGPMIALVFGGALAFSVFRTGAKPQE
ncbi:MAG: cytochrome c-type biogenesis protein [Pseudomonadota bacterium]